jgi:diguanylate cyclase (GGDEF)-like protein
MAPALRLPLRAVILIGLYLLATDFADRFIAAPGSVSLLWPAAGLALAAVVRYGLKWAWFVPVAMLIAHLTLSPAPAAFIPFSLLSNLAGVLVGGWWIRRDDTSEQMDTRWGFRVLVGAMLMAGVSAVIGIGGMELTGMLPPGTAANGLIKWFLGDLLGIVAVAPTLLLFTIRHATRHSRAQGPHYGSETEKLAWNIVLVASYLLMAWGGAVGSDYALGLSALPLAVAVWSALRFEPLRTAIAVLLSTLLVGTLVGRGLSGFRPPTRALDSAILLSYLCAMAILPMILALTVHERRLAARRLLKQARTDALTGLPNRSAFEHDVRKLLDDAAEPPLAIAYLDLDNFALVNDTASHVAGDELINGVAGLLRSTLPASDLLAHLGGDEFAMALRNCSPTMARERMAALVRAVETYRCAWNGQVLTTTASVGVVPFRRGDAEFAELLSQADAACFTAKEQGGNRVCMAGVHAGDVLDRTAAMRWAVRIREALEQHRFVLYAQSIEPLRTPAGGKAGANPESSRRHFELLLRMRDEKSGAILGPDQFMSAAERFRLGLRIDREVVNMALAWLEENPVAAQEVAVCGINLSAEALGDEGFNRFLSDRLRNSSFPASRLCLELTETSAVRDLGRAQRFINDLRALGCRFALDDFGTGFCSFNYLRSLDVDYFKIDGSFVRDLESSSLSMAVIRSITDIAHVLDKQTIAEHTENEAILSSLRELGVDYAQGYGIHRPEPLADFFAHPGLPNRAPGGTAPFVSAPQDARR